MQLEYSGAVVCYPVKVGGCRSVAKKVWNILSFVMYSYTCREGGGTVKIRRGIVFTCLFG